mgnify:CR=1 FL=1
MNNYEFLTQADWRDPTSYDKFLNLLQSLAKYESALDQERHIKILNTKQKVYALSMADIRLIAKNISKSNGFDFLKVVKYNSYEETTITGIVIALIKDLDLQTKLLADWATKIDNWSSCDTVVSTMKTLKNSKDKSKYFEHYKQMCFDKREFVARFGIVCLMVNFLEESYIDDILSVCKQIKHQGYYVKMAVAWLISFAFMKFRDKTYALLEEKCLDKFTQNKAICKCRDSYQVSAEDKQTLISLRIK